jgi:hypothetical protein
MGYQTNTLQTIDCPAISVTREMFLKKWQLQNCLGLVHERASKPFPWDL